MIILYTERRVVCYLYIQKTRVFFLCRFYPHRGYRKQLSTLMHTGGYVIDVQTVTTRPLVYGVYTFPSISKNVVIHQTQKTKLFIRWSFTFFFCDARVHLQVHVVVRGHCNTRGVLFTCYYTGMVIKVTNQGNI